MKLINLLSLLLLVSMPATGSNLNVVTFNVDSSANTYPYRVGEIIQQMKRPEILALQEVDNEKDLAWYAAAASLDSGYRYRYVMSRAGRKDESDRLNDFLAIVYNGTVLRLLETIELDTVRSRPDTSSLGIEDMRLLPVLFARFQHRISKQEFYVGNVDFKCCSSGEAIRAHQARLLVEWISRTNVPVILTGNFSIVLDPEYLTNITSTAFNRLTRTLKWLKPSNPVKTLCDPHYDSMTDHFFLKGGLTVADVTVLFEEDGYCQRNSTGGPGYRPVSAVFQFSR